jgi:hypothetical protein
MRVNAPHTDFNRVEGGGEGPGASSVQTIDNEQDSLSRRREFELFRVDSCSRDTSRGLPSRTGHSCQIKPVDRRTASTLQMDG